MSEAHDLAFQDLSPLEKSTLDHLESLYDSADEEQREAIDIVEQLIMEQGC